MGRLYESVGAVAVIAAFGAAIALGPDTDAIARNQFTKYAQTIEGRQAITDTLKKLREFPHQNATRISNLERALSIAPTINIDGPIECPRYPFPLCLDNVADMVDDYALGEIRL